MFGGRPRFIRPGDEILYPAKNKDGEIETLINPNLDSALTGDNDSKTNFVYNRYHHLPLETQRQKLPVFQYRNHILYLLERYQTLILIGETGCGKSTQVPQYMFEVGHNVCVTQPRVTAAMSLAHRVAEERGEILGQSIGYAAGATAVRSSEGIVFMTEGVLLREMFASPLLMQYSCIILDEVHERTLMTDVLMGLLKKIAKKRKNLKLIISSATMDAEFLKDFFNLADRKEKEKNTSVIMSMSGRAHPIEVFYTEEPVPDYVKATVDTVIKIHENEPFGDILAFLTSQEEIHEALETLQTYATSNNEMCKQRKYFPSGIQASNISILPLYGSLPKYRQLKAFQLGDRATRRVIISTNISETSVTIPRISYVIDCGFHKLAYFDPKVGVEGLSIAPISKNNAIQRAGRAGRQSRGKCFRLYTEEQYDKLPDSIPPEMCRSDLSNILLQLKALGINNLLKFTFPTPPPAKSLLAALDTLLALGAIDKNGDLTSGLGEHMAELPCRVALAKMLCKSGEYGCLEEILSIVAMLQVDSVFVKTHTGKGAIAARVSRRNNFEVAEGDIIMYLNIFDAYMRVRKSESDEKRSKKAGKDWCNKVFLNYRVMEKACEVRDGLEKLVKKKFQIENKIFEGPDLGTGKTVRTMKCVLSGLFPLASRLSPTGQYRGVRGASADISPDSCLARAPRPPWLVFLDVQFSGDKCYMRNVMAIEKEWLLEVAPHYFKET